MHRSRNRGRTILGVSENARLSRTPIEVRPRPLNSRATEFCNPPQRVQANPDRKSGRYLGLRDLACRTQNDEARVQPKSSGARQSDQPGTSAALPSRDTQASRIGRRWEIIDPRRFHFPVYSRGRIVELWLSADEASKGGTYMAAVGRFLSTGDASVLSFSIQTPMRPMSQSRRPWRQWGRGSIAGCFP
jgi:hypothetical protein